jgi:nitrous oxidase accessory protein
MTTPMPKSSRLLTAAAALLLLGLFVWPAWRISLEAPQYPEGIGMYIRINTIEGASEFDLQKINSLNHYIGMRPIVPESIPELRWMPWIVAALVASGLVVAALGRRKGVYAWLVLFALLGLAGLGDFYRWSYDYGHNLDAETAIITVPGMTYQPPLIGEKQLLNFRAASWPATGGLLAGLAFAAAAAAAVLSSRAGQRGRGTIAMLALVPTAACAAPAHPHLLAYDGSVTCAWCQMAITDRRQAAQLVTKTGKVLNFDSAECLASYYDALPAVERAVALWVTNPDAPGVLIAADAARLRGLAGSPHGGAMHATTANAPVPMAAAHAELTALRGQTAVITVSPSGPIRTIRDAIAIASEGARIVVQAGHYREPRIVVDKRVEIAGEGWPVLDGDGAHEIMTVTADSVSVRGLVLRNVGTSYVEDRAAIRVVDASGCVIEDNRIEDAFFGIYLAGVEECRIGRNIIRAQKGAEASSGNGVHLWSSRAVTVEDNRISGHRDGIYLEFTHASLVQRNVSEGNLRYGLHFMYADDCRYIGNEFRKNLAGVAVMYTKRIEMTGNRFEDNWGSASYGLLLKEISDPTIVDNEFTRNTVGLVADGAARIVARGNRFTGNGWAVKLMASSYDGRFEANEFVGNSFDVAANSMESSNRFRGNYFDAYRGYDLDADGSGDVPHRPVRLYSVLVERNPPALILLRSFFPTLLELAEQVLPALTPAALVDDAPAMRRSS